MRFTTPHIFFTLFFLSLSLVQVAFAEEPKTNKDIVLEQTVVRLPGAVSALKVGGGGRYIVMCFSELKKLGIFDVKEEKVIKTMPFDGGNLSFAVGAKKLFIVYGGQHLLSRHDLPTLTREKMVTLDTKDPIQFAEMGSAANNFILLGTRSRTGTRGFQFYDVNTMRRIKVKYKSGGIGSLGERARVSADGHMICSWQVPRSRESFITMSLNGDTFYVLKKHWSLKHMYPAPDGTVLYAPSGAWTPHGVHIKAEKREEYLLPAVHGQSLIAFDFNVTGLGSRPRTAGIYLQGDPKRLLTLHGFILPRSASQQMQSMPLDQKYHLIPDQKLIVEVDMMAKKLNLYYFDLEGSLKSSGVDFLYVSSKPESSVRLGKQYRYQLKAVSNQKELKYKLTYAPEGMTISPQGLLTWDVPKEDSTLGEKDVMVTVSSPAGKETIHSFKLQVLDNSGLFSTPAPKNPFVKVEKK